MLDAESGESLLDEADLASRGDCERVAAILAAVARRTDHAAAAVAARDTDSPSFSMAAVEEATAELAKQNARGVPEVFIKAFFKGKNMSFF